MRVLYLEKPGPAQQRAQRGIAERGLVEFGEVLVAAASVQQHGIADIVQRRAVLAGGQRAVGGPGNMLKTHEILSELMAARRHCRFQTTPDPVAAGPSAPASL